MVFKLDFASKTPHGIYTFRKFINADTRGHLLILFLDHPNSLLVFLTCFMHMKCNVACFQNQWRIQGAPPARPPYGSRFFWFDIQIFRNVATSGVGAPPSRSAPPLWEILDPLLKIFIHIHLNSDS